MGYVKYGLVVLLSAWMFFLGVLVGRGTAPVSFDTQRLQKRLAGIAEECTQRLNSVSRPDLVFYEVLKKPARTGGDNSLENQGEILPAGIGRAGAQKAAAEKQVKKSRKTISRKVSAGKSDTAGQGDAMQKLGKDRTTGNQAGAVKEEAVTAAVVPDPAVRKGDYTIQVASFKDFAAVAVHRAFLKKKGYSSYRVMGKVGDSIWIRVRTGEFATRAEATAQLKHLEADGIKGLIIKRD